MGLGGVKILNPVITCRYDLQSSTDGLLWWSVFTSGSQDATALLTTRLFLDNQLSQAQKNADLQQNISLSKCSVAAALT